MKWFFFKGVRLDRVRGGRQKYKRRPEVENATYQSAPLPLTKETEKGEMYIPVMDIVILYVFSFCFMYLVFCSIAGHMAEDNWLVQIR